MLPGAKRITRCPGARDPERRRVDDVTRAVLYPWVSESLVLLQEAQRMCRAMLMRIDEAEGINGRMPATRHKLENFIQRAEQVLKASSE